MVSSVSCTVNGFNSHMAYGEKQGGSAGGGECVL